MTILRTSVLALTASVLSLTLPSAAQAQSTAECANIPAVAHRGATGAGRENTIEGWNRNRLRNDVHFVETDLTLTKDGVPVIFHDKNMKRTTGVDRFIRDVNYANLPRTLDGYEIPTFAKSVAWANRVGDQMLIEVKVPLNWDQINTIVANHGMDLNNLTYDYQPGNLPDGFSMKGLLDGHTGIKTYSGPPGQADQYGDSLRINYTDASANKDAFDQAGVTNLFQKTSDGVYTDRPELWAPAVESGSIDYMITNTAGDYNRWCATQQ